MSDNPFNGEQLQGVKYSRADMEGAEFDGVNLKDAKLWVVMEGTSVRDSNLSKLDVDDATLAGSKFHNVNMSDVTIDNANMTRFSITNANLTGASISNANMTDMRIQGVLVTDLFEAYEKSKT